MFVDQVTPGDVTQPTLVAHCGRKHTGAVVVTGVTEAGVDGVWGDRAVVVCNKVAWPELAVAGYTVPAPKTPKLAGQTAAVRHRTGPGCATPWGTHCAAFQLQCCVGGGTADHPVMHAGPQ